MDETRAFIRDSLNGMVPFAGHTGIEITELTPSSGIAVLEPTSETMNHLGTVHAGALFTLGEAASGAAMSGVFAEKILEVVPVAASAKVQYLAPARGTIFARARVASPNEELLKTLSDEEKVRFAVEVSLTDEKELEVCTLSVDWHVSKKRENGSTKTEDGSSK